MSTKKTSFVLACIRTSTAQQDEKEQLEVLKASGLPYDDLIIFPKKNGAIPLCFRRSFKKKILEIRTQHPGIPIVVLVTHVDRFFKAESIRLTQRTWKRLRSLGIELRSVAPVPDLRDISPGALRDEVYRLLSERLLGLAKAHSFVTPRIDRTNPKIRVLVSAIAGDLARIAGLPESTDPEFVKLASAWRIFGGYRLFLAAIGTGTGGAARDPGGWGSDPVDLEFFGRIRAASENGQKKYKAIATALGEKPHIIKYVLNGAAGYAAYCMPVVVPKEIAAFTLERRERRYRPYRDQASSALSAGGNVLFDSATASRKTLVALKHHRRLLAKNPNHLTVVCVPNVSMVHQFVGRHGGVGLAGKKESPLVQQALCALKDHSTGGLLFAVPDWLHRDEVWRSIRSHASVCLVADEADAAVADANYRDSYLNFPDIVRNIRPDQVLAMTASCPPAMRPLVKRQVIPKGQGWTVIRAPLDRPNLHYSHEYSANDTARRVRIAMICGDRVRHGQRGIVYLDTRKRVDRTQQYLRGYGLRVGGYHSGRSASANNRVIDKFERGELDVVVATSGFGRGMDFDVGFVVVSHIPENLSVLAQYHGRNGRDGKPAVCWWITSECDRFFLKGCRKKIVQSSQDDRTKEVLLEMVNEIERAADVAHHQCTRAILLGAHARKKGNNDPFTCCGVCRRKARRAARKKSNKIHTHASPVHPGKPTRSPLGLR